MRENIPVIRLQPDLGDDGVVARDGVVICFFMRHSHGEVAPAIWRALQTYLRAIPPQALAWYGSPDGDTLPLDDKGWEHIRKKMLERPQRNACHIHLEEDCSAVGGYHFEYDGRRLDAPLFSDNENATSGVLFTFPTEYLLEHGPAHLHALTLELARELPFSFGYASLAIVAPHGLWFAARRSVIPLLSRYLGLDIYRLRETSGHIGTRARGAYWLTFLGQPLLGQLGGEEGLRHKLSFPQVSFQPLEGERLLITLGEWPDAIDTANGAYVPEYRTLAHLLEPYLYEERDDWFSLLPPGTDNMRRWIRRLCQ
ncbi:type VI immunity family protein [Hyalangium sp.]|uniref:type VI immunity family protein n=1 Tax=Hyalangium sp. TaxID=2028555 RepID=UPI002D2A00E8|nr:type VI immunity family protein [Hyalangium sp.]HYI03055.1 type VI immunity family protein [Hyalangium sp.]